MWCGLKRRIAKQSKLIQTISKAVQDIVAHIVRRVNNIFEGVDEIENHFLRGEIN
jgi:hypothetical protein